MPTPAPVTSGTPEARPGRPRTYNQILKSSALIGGSSLVNIGIGIVRTKAMALLLGPTGFGLMGIYGSIVSLAQSIASMGIGSSGVRQIAEAVGSGDEERVARTVTVMRRISVFLGLLGAALLWGFSRRVSVLSFGDTRHSGAVALLSLAVFLGLVSGGQGALIQGMRRIADMAWMGILATLCGTVISVSLVYFLGEKGIVLSLIALSAMSSLISWWFSRKVRVKPAVLSVSQVGEEVSALLKLGFAFMASGFLTMGAGYAVRIMVLRIVGYDAAGLYSSAWTLGGLYVGYILGAMGTDFYPRLTAVAKDHAECNQMVNEQAEIGLLLAGPGVLATLTCAPFVIALFYSAKFGPAVGLLRWFCLATTIQVLTFPMGFILLAKNESKLFLFVDGAWTIMNIALSWVCIKYFGLVGAGIAYFASYIFHALVVYPIVRRLTGFRWSAANKRMASLYLSLIALVFCASFLKPLWLVTTAGFGATLFSLFYSIRVLLRLGLWERVPRQLRGLAARLRLAPSPKRDEHNNY